MGSRNTIIANYSFFLTILLLLFNGRQISCNSVNKISKNQLCASLSILDSVNDIQTKYEVPIGLQHPRSTWETLTSSPNATVNYIQVLQGCKLRICHLSDGNIAKMQKCDDFVRNEKLSIEDTKLKYKWDTLASSVLGLDCSCKLEDANKSCSNDCKNYPITDQCQCATLFLDEFCDDCNYNPIPLYIGSSYSRKHNLSVINSIFVKKNCLVQGFNGKNGSGIQIEPFTFLPDKIQYRQRINDFNYDFQSFKCTCQHDDFNLDELCQAPVEVQLGSLEMILLGLLGLAVLISILIAILLVDRGIQRYRQEKHLYSVIKNLDKKWIIPEEQIKIDYNTVLGEGRFGKVYKAILRRGNADPDETVAVKAIKSSSMDSKYFGTLATEITILSTIGTHPNVVSMIGIVFKNKENSTVIVGSEVLLVLEYCKHNSLEVFIRKHRNKFLQNIEGYLGFSSEIPGYMEHKDYLSNYIEESDEKAETEEHTCQYLGLQSLTQWCYDIGCGMEHISGLNIVHIDLAARNILLGENLKAKVSDFGLSKQLNDDSQYYFKPPIKHPLPKHPMALEVMKDFKFSLQSDVWAYGVCIWELFTLGQIPYEDLEKLIEIEDLIRRLEQGYRLPKPDICPTAIYEEMCNCWIADPSKRPDFTKLKLFFSNYLTNLGVC